MLLIKLLDKKKDMFDDIIDQIDFAENDESDEEMIYYDLKLIIKNKQLSRDKKIFKRRRFEIYVI